MRRTSTFLLILLAGFTLSRAQNLSMEQCVQLALENNRTLQRGELTVRQSRINTRQSYANWYPSVSVSAGERGQKSDLSGDTWDPKWSLSASARQSLYSPGMYSRVKLSRINEKISELAYQDSQALIRKNVETSYYNILSSLALIAVYEENIRVADANLRKIRRMYEMGAKTESDVLKSEVQKGDFESALMSEEMNLVNQERTLNILLGRSPDMELTLEAVDVERLDIPDLASARKIVFEKNRELITLQQNQKGAQVNLQIAREAYLPSVSSSYSYSKAENYVGGQQVGSSSIGLSTSLGLFDGFRKKQDVQSSQLEVRKSEIEIDQVKKELLNALLNYYSTLETYNNMMVLQEKNLESAQKDFELVSRQYELGMSTILDQMNAQLSVLKSQSNLVKAKFARKVVESQIRQLLAL